MSIGQAARMAMVSRRTISRWIRDGKLRAGRVAGRGRAVILVRDLYVALFGSHVPAGLQDLPWKEAGPGPYRFEMGVRMPDLGSRTPMPEAVARGAQIGHGWMLAALDWKPSDLDCHDSADRRDAAESATERLARATRLLAVEADRLGVPSVAAVELARQLDIVSAGFERFDSTRAAIDLIGAVRRIAEYAIAVGEGSIQRAAGS